MTNPETGERDETYKQMYERIGLSQEDMTFLLYRAGLLGILSAEGSGVKRTFTILREPPPSLTTGSGGCLGSLALVASLSLALVGVLVLVLII